MSWGSLAGNQFVSFTNASGSGLPLNSGESHVTSNKWMTKSEAISKYNLNAGALAGFASNQWVTKNALYPGGTSVSCVSVTPNSAEPSGYYHYVTVSFLNRPAPGSTFSIGVFGNISGHQSNKNLTEADLDGSNSWSGYTDTFVGGGYNTGDTLTGVFNTFSDGTYYFTMCGGGDYY